MPESTHLVVASATDRIVLTRVTRQPGQCGHWAMRAARPWPHRALGPFRVRMLSSEAETLLQLISRTPHLSAGALVYFSVVHGQADLKAPLRSSCALRVGRRAMSVACRALRISCLGLRAARVVAPGCCVHSWKYGLQQHHVARHPLGHP